MITGFPFLISKEAGIFASFQTSYAAEMSRISRRHAYISVEQENIKLTDMESTNGTFVNNDRIDGQGKVLQNGDIISFGGNFFSYIVKLNLPDQQQIDDDATQFSPVTEPKQVDKQGLNAGEKEADKVAPVFDEINEPRTTFVNDPSPFLDILCEDESVSEPVETVSTEGKSSEISSPKTSFFSKKLFFLSQLFDALKDKKPAKNKWRFISLLSVLLLTIAGVAFFYFYNRSADVEELINQGDYPKAAEQSMQLLDQAPENMTLLNLSTKAILNSIVPQWQNDLNNNDFSQAETLVKETQSKFAANPNIEKVLPLMQWINRLYQFMSMRNENAKIVIFQNEHQLSSLMDTWGQNKKQNELTLALIRRNVPAFKATYNEILSFIRTLEHDQDIYINAINTLKTNILSKLQANQTDELMTEVAQFEKKYRAVLGIEDLKFDIYRYIELNDALKSKDIDLINKMRQQMAFNTPLFKQFAEQTLKEKFPSEAFSTQYHGAIQSWQTGDIEITINKLAGLSDDRWGPAALNKLKRYQSVLDKYNALNKSSNTDQYIENLFNFHALLQLPEDNYFLSAIEKDFQENKNQAIETVQSNVDRAGEYWQQYTNKGGISSLLRLENQISKTYQNQAGLLAKAHHDISYARRLYTELQISDNAEWNQIYSAISEEMNKQKKWLKDLELILKPSALLLYPSPQ